MYRRFPATTILIAAALGCEISSNESAEKQDTTTAPNAGAAGADTFGTAAGAVGVAAVPDDSAVVPDTGVVIVVPDAPVRGGVVLARVPGLRMQTPRCVWSGAPTSCFTDSAGVTALIALPIDSPAGPRLLTIDRPAGSLARTITVREREFGREVILLDSARWALVRRTSDIARDARAMRQILANVTPATRWTGGWRDPIKGTRKGFGVERAYAPASDSTRVIPIASGTSVRGSLGTDTSAAGRFPGWRHTGVDIVARRGTIVIAPAAAIVADVGEYTLTGRTVVLDHGRGVMSAYFHLDTVLVRKGDEPDAGDGIGRVGETGLATGPHLHYAVYLNGTAVDPAVWHQAVAELRRK